MFTTGQNRPHFTGAEAIRLAGELYGLEVQARELASERDQNFHLVTKAGREFVLKIASATDNDEVLDFQNQAMGLLAKQDPPVTCPRVCATSAGESIARVKAPDGTVHRVRLLTYLPGVFLADFRPHSPALLHSLGVLFGRIDKALVGYSHPSSNRELKWDMRLAGSVIRTGANHIQDPGRRSLLDHFAHLFEKEAGPILPALRTSIIHNDGNDHNILVAFQPADEASVRVDGIIDFGDMLRTITAAEPAIAAAYALLGKGDPLAAAAEVIRGYHEVYPLGEDEIRALYPMICARLATSVAVSALQQKEEPDKPYLSISEKQAWESLELLAGLNPQLAHCTFRQACGFEPCPRNRAVVEWLKNNRGRIGPVVEPSLAPGDVKVLDLSVGSLELEGPADWEDPARFTEILFGRMRATGAAVGIGRYGEARAIYTGEAFRLPSDEIEERRTVHLGTDLFLEAGSRVFAPLDGKIHSFADNALPSDYGPTIILEHSMNEEPGSFFTLYGHLSPQSLDGLKKGMQIKKGSRLGLVGDFPFNGNWPPHLHFQVLCDILGREGDFPGVAAPRSRETWLSLCPDPNLVLQIPDACFPPGAARMEGILALRGRHLSRALSISYRRPLKIVRGFMQHLYDDEGRRYLDAVNNVPHVGHSHPRVVRAAREQMAVLNTNTRYLHENIVRYAERLCATLPEPLRICFFVNSGSEANDLALRLARAHSRRKGVIVVEGAYHGNLTSLIEISPYKFDGPGGTGTPSHVRKVPMPDTYRGPYKSADINASAKYACHVERAVEEAGGEMGAFICESVLSCGGQIVLPPHYLQHAYRHVRSGGGLCIADEVQVGFGRIGTHFWAFESQQVVPDIVTAGKPIGNGHPLGAVITTPEIADSFANGMEYFNTFGGNPVSCAVGLAVLGVMEQEGLQARALQVGTHLLSGLGALSARHSLVGDVRGMGLFIGVELVRNRRTLEPAAAEATYIVERMKDHGILVSTDGPLHNVIKIKPPMVFAAADADFLVATLDKVLAETPLMLQEM